MQETFPMPMKSKHQESSQTREKSARKKSRTLTKDKVYAFQAEIYQYYQAHARKFPWRETKDPYHILVSELMLQQTQTERVIRKYEEFASTFPDFSSLARAPLRKILEVWQGLGYNRRALALKDIAGLVAREFDGKLPSSADALTTFPGIGRATASAISAFAFNQPAVFIETNIRRVFIHFFFKDNHSIKDSEILPLVEKTLDTSNPREWYFALMDYGVMLKKGQPNPNRRSAHYQKQSRFEGSNRQIRGMVLKALVARPSATESELAERIEVSPERLRNVLMQLRKEGFIRSKGRRFALA
jgi:A/G-specific adenine glycosylase